MRFPNFSPRLTTKCRFRSAVLAAGLCLPLSAQAVWEVSPEEYVAGIFASAEFCRDRMPMEVETGLKFLLAQMTEFKMDIEAIQNKQAYKEAYEKEMNHTRSLPEAEQISGCDWDWKVFGDGKTRTIEKAPSWMN